MENEVKTDNSHVHVFSFGDNNIRIGDAESVLINRNIFGGFMWSNDKYYYPPHNPQILARLVHASPHHESALRIKQNLLVRDFLPTDYMSRADFRKYVQNFNVLGNGFLEVLRSRSGKVLKVQTLPGVNMRVGKIDGEFWFVDEKYNDILIQNEVCHLKDHDLEQEIYGIPAYLGAVQSILLNESATIFRRRYYINGAHAGFIFYLSDSDLTDDDAQAIKKQIEGSKGVGNFKNMFLHIPDGKPESIKIIPIAEAQAKDIFAEIKNTSAKDIMTSHRVPPQLLGQAPETAGGNGDFLRVSDATYFNEIEALQQIFLETNDALGAEIIKFREYKPLSNLVQTAPTK